MIIRAEEGKIIIELNEHEKELSINEDEVTLANRALNRFVNLGLDANRLVLKQNTTSYATISYRGNSFDWDLIRFKYTNRAKMNEKNMNIAPYLRLKRTRDRQCGRLKLNQSKT